MTTPTASTDSNEPSGRLVRFRTLLVRRSPDRILLLFLLLSVFAWMPLTSPGYFFDAHDAHHSVIYLIEFDQNIRDGVFWPRWSPDHAMGFGYPFWLFYSPLSYYVAEGFVLVGLGYTAAVKATFLLAFLASGLAMYHVGKRWWGASAGLVAALAYTYAPYHLVDIYVRAAFAEFFAFIWFPWALLAFWDLSERGGWRRACLAGLTYGLVVLSHSALMILFSLFLGLYLLFLILRQWRLSERQQLRRIVGYLALAVILGISLSAIVWLPALADSGNISQGPWTQGNYLYSRQFVYPHQFLSNLWDFGYAVEGPDDGMSLQLGLMPVVLAIFAAAAAIRRRVARRSLVFFLLVATLVTVLAITPIAAPLWRLIPLGPMIQFPWRALTLTTVTLALLAGAAVSSLDSKGDGGEEGWSMSPAAAAIALIIVLASISYTQPELTPITPRDDSVLAVFDFEFKHPDMIGSMAWAEPPQNSSLIPQYEAGVLLNKGVILSGEGTVEALHHGGASDVLLVRANTSVRLLVQTYWYPGWRAWIDDRPVPIEREGPHALIALDVPAGEHRVELRFTDTPLRRWSAIVSLVTLIVLGAVWLVKRR